MRCPGVFVLVRRHGTPEELGRIFFAHAHLRRLRTSRAISLDRQPHRLGHDAVRGSESPETCTVYRSLVVSSRYTRYDEASCLPRRGIPTWGRGRAASQSHPAPERRGLVARQPGTGTGHSNDDRPDPRADGHTGLALSTCPDQSGWPSMTSHSNFI